LREPPAIFTLDPALNRDSARQVAELRPKLICFGHGPPLKESQKLVEFVSQLPVTITVGE
jgi:glyoxylase-like metal-dependent hydrolase (beta-lactamase superfamily II)